MRLSLGKYLGGLALCVGLALGMAAPAHAANYTCNEGGNPPPGTFINDNVSISESGPCTLTTGVSAYGNIIITAGGNVDVSAAPLSAGQGVGISISTTSGFIKAGTIDSNNNDVNGGNVLLSAPGNIETGNITGHGVTTAEGIEIHANTGGTSSVFKVGGGGTNGTGILDVSTAQGGGTQTNSINGGVYVANGTQGSTGGITVSLVNNAMPIKVLATQSRSGIIALDAMDGTITLPAGTLDSSGQGSNGAGIIQLNANTVKTVNGTIINAAQSAAATGTYHGVVIAAKSIVVAGSTGLAIHADGNGVSGASASAYAFLVPEGAITFSTNNDTVNNEQWTQNFNNAYTTNGAMTVSGMSGKFTVTANGNDAEVAVSGYPIHFSNGVVELTSLGNSDHQVQLYYGGSFTGSDGLTMNGNGAITLDASGLNSGDNGGTVQVYVDQATITANKTLTIQSNGKGSGKGGTVTFQPSKLVSMSTPTVLLAANNGTSTSGYGTVNFQPGGGGGPATITSTNFTVSANGPTSGNGNAGSVNFYAGSLTLGSSTIGKITANATGTGSALYNDPTVSSNPLAIKFYPGTMTSGLQLGTNPGQFSLSANGGNNQATTGTAGAIAIGVNGNVQIQTASAITANSAGGNGKGGWIYLNNYLNSVANNASSITALGSGTGGGGKFQAFNGVAGGFDINNVIKVDAGSQSPVTNQDGTITLSNNGATNNICGQWKIGTGTGNTTWPLTYWNCVNPTAPGALDSAPATLANSTSLQTIASAFGKQPVQLYVFPNLAQVNSFQNSNYQGEAQGVTFEADADVTIFSNVFPTGLPAGQQGLDNMQEITAHELGHAADFVNNVQSTTADYLTYVAADFAYLDYSVFGNSAQTSTPRSPCVGTGAPFAGLNDETNGGQPYCVTTMTNGYTQIPNSNPAVYIENKYIPNGVLMLNSQILQANAYFMWNATEEGWLEVYAQTFAFQAYAKTIPQSYYYTYTADNLFANGWFDCTLDWAGYVLSNATLPPPTPPTPYPSSKGFGACNTPAIPNWYRTQLGH